MNSKIFFGFCYAIVALLFLSINNSNAGEVPRFLQEGQYYQIYLKDSQKSENRGNKVLISAIDPSGWVWMTELTVYRRYTEKGKDPIHESEFSARLEAIKDEKEKKQFALLFDIEQTLLIPYPDSPYINGWVNVAYITQIKRINLNRYVIPEAEDFGSIPHHWKDKFQWSRCDQKEFTLNDSRLPWKE